MNTLQVRFDDDALAQLKKIAADENRKVANVVQTMVLDALKARDKE